MARPATKKKLLHEPLPELASDPVSMPDVPVAAVFSFLKDMRGVLTWTQRDLSQTLNMNDQDAAKILTILKLQGYIGETEDQEFLTTSSGELVSGSKPPRFTRECVDGAVSELFDRIAASNRNRNADFKIIEAVAFGDFLSGRANCQAADIGIKLEPREEAAAGRGQESTFLKQLRNKSLFLNIRMFEKWMSQRSHRRLL